LLRDKFNFINYWRYNFWISNPILPPKTIYDYSLEEIYGRGSGFQGFGAGANSFSLGSIPSRSPLFLGRIGIEAGSDSGIKYGTTSGKVTSIDGLLILSLIAVDKNTQVSDLNLEIGKLI